MIWGKCAGTAGWVVMDDGRQSQTFGIRQKYRVFVIIVLKLYNMCFLKVSALRKKGRERHL